MSSTHFGTSSWSEKGWVGSFYPPGTPPRGFLSYYATQFDTVEADVTYYRIPDLKMVRGWRERTPEGFRFAAKFPRSIVHCGEGPQPDGEKVLAPGSVDADTREFLGAMGELGEKCGPLVLQFPYFNRRAFETVEPFLERLDAYLGRLPQRFRYGVEVRNKGWVGEPLLDVLRRHRAAFVLVDLPYMPLPTSIAKRVDPFPTDFTYVRLIGDRKATEALTKTFDRIVLDRESSLLRWADFLRPVIARGTETFAFANNHFAGHGPTTIRELARQVGGIELPGGLETPIPPSDQEPPLFRR